MIKKSAWKNNSNVPVGALLKKTLFSLTLKSCGNIQNSTLDILK